MAGVTARESVGTAPDTNVRLQRVVAGSPRDAFMPFFLLADDSDAYVRSYYQQGDLLVFGDDDGLVLGITLVIPDGRDGAELKAVAIASNLQGQGLGQRMLALVLADLRAAGVRRVTVGTSSSAIGALAFYQKAGFRLRRIERDFFNPSRGYPQGITENGIPVRDMVWMDQEL